MDIKYSKTKETPVVEIIREEFCLVSAKPAGEYDRTFTDIELFAGEEYTVECGGTEYSCTAWEKDGKIHIGGKGEPFDIYRLENDIWMQVSAAFADDSIGHTISIHILAVKTKPLPAKFMPEPIVFTTADMQTFSCNKSYEECVSAFNENNFNAYFKGFNAEGASIAAPTQSAIKYSDNMYYYISLPEASGGIHYYSDGTITIEFR